MNGPCEKMRDKIADNVLGLLNDRQEIETLEQHLAQCPACRQYAESLQNEKRSLLQFGQALDGEMPARLHKVMDALNKGKEKTSHLSIWRIIMKSRISIPFPVAAGFLIVFCLQLILQFANFSHKAAQNKPQATVVKAAEQSAQDFSQQSVYIPGTGFVKKSTIYNF